MKKSFLKRVTAAVIALPVALSQTVLFASFAEESNAVEAINIDSFLTVPASQALYTPQDGEVYRALEKQKEKDANENYSYFIQESVWNSKISNAVGDYSGETFTIDATSFAQYISDRTWFGEMIKNAFADPINQAYANVHSDGVELVADVNYAYEKFAMDILNRSIPESYKNVDFTLETDGIVDAKVIVFGDTTALADGAGKAARTIPYTVEIEWDGQKLTTVQDVYEKVISVVNTIRQDTKDSVAKKFSTYESERDAAQKALDDARAAGASADVIAEKQAELDAKSDRLENAHKMVNFKVDEIFDNYVNRINNAKTRYDNQLAKDIERGENAKPYADVDELLAKADEVFQNNVKNKRANDAFPASLSEFQGKSYYSTVNKIFNNVLEQINSQTAEKSTSGTTYSINLTVDEILDKAAEVYDIYAYGKHVAGQEAAEGYAYGYIDDTSSDANLDEIEKLVSEKLAAEGLELKPGSLYTVKAVEVEGNGGVQSGAGTLDIYRIVRFETIEPEVTTTSTETTTTTETVITTDAIVTTETDVTATTAETEATATNTETQATATNTETQATATNTETQATATNTETQATATNTETQATATNTETQATATNTETQATATNTETQATATNTETQATATNTETQATATNTETQATATNTETQATATNTETQATATNTETQATATNTETQATVVTTETLVTEATNVTDVTEATNVTDVTEATNVTDVTEATNVTDVTEATGATDATEATGATDVTEATGVTDATEATGATDATDATSASEVPTDVADEIVIEDLVTKEAFFFSHDPNKFEISELIEVSSIVAKSGDKTVDIKRGDGSGDTLTLDLDKFTFGTVEGGEDPELSPSKIYTDRKEAYNKIPLVVYYDGKRVKGTADIYIGVKGDADLNGVVNSIDAANVLVYAARVGAGEEAYIYSADEPILNRFAFFLADTTDESKNLGVTSGIVGKTEKSVLDSIDAANILVYAAKAGANGTADWIPEVLLNAPYPEYSRIIAEKAGLLPTENQ